MIFIFSVLVRVWSNERMLPISRIMIEEIDGGG